MPMILFKADGGMDFAPEGAKLTDGTCVQLADGALSYMKEHSLVLGDTSFSILLESNGEELARHDFKMERFDGGCGLWLLADPTKTDLNGSFTGKFFRAFIDAGNGVTPFTVKVGVKATGGDTTWVSEGNGTFDGANGTSKYEAILAHYGDAAGAREAANAASSAAYDKKREEDSAAKHAKNHFKVVFKNKESSKTVYVICKDLKSLSENIVEVQAGKSVAKEFWRGSRHEIRVYAQNTSKDSSRQVVASLDESREGQEIVV